MRTFYTILFLLIFVVVEAQQNIDLDNDKVTISIGSGLSFYSVKDQNISNEKYSGVLKPISFSWSSSLTDRQFRDFYFSIQTGNIHNLSFEAHVNELTMGWDYGFKLNPNKQYDLFIGPAPFFYFHNRNQSILLNYHINSNIGIVSLGSVFGIKSNNLNGFNYKFAGRLGLLSACVNTENDRITKILSPFNGLQFFFSAQSSYKLSNWADVGFKYSFQTYYITAWNKMYSLSDQLTLNLIISFQQ